MTIRNFVVILIFSCLTLSIAAHASCNGTPVENYGAVGNGTTDDTSAIQSAITAVAANGGGSVVLSVKRYYTTGTFSLPTGVVLCGTAEGPFDLPYINPGTTTIAPTLLVTNTSSTFITLSGPNAGVTDILFYYPNQAAPTASAPISYPWTIVVNQPGAKIRRCTAVNAYQFLNIEVGRVAAEDLVIGGFLFGIYVDNAYDHVTINNIIQSTVWDFPYNLPLPTNLDTWAYNHGTGFAILHADNINIHNVLVYYRSSGFFLTGTSSGYGLASDIDLDSVGWGIVAQSSNPAGYKFTNIEIAAAYSGVNFMSGGTPPPTVEINGGSITGTLLGGAFPPIPTPFGKLVVVNVLGYDK